MFLNLKHYNNNLFRNPDPDITGVPNQFPCVVCNLTSVGHNKYLEYMSAEEEYCLSFGMNWLQETASVPHCDAERIIAMRNLHYT